MSVPGPSRPNGPAPAAAPIKDAIGRLIDALQQLVRDHLALARVELEEELTSMARALAASASGIPLLVSGWILLMVAAAIGLSAALPSWLAFALVAVVNLAVGAAVTVHFGRRLARERLELPRTTAELRRDKDLLGALQTPAPALGAANREASP